MQTEGWADTSTHTSTVLTVFIMGDMACMLGTEREERETVREEDEETFSQFVSVRDMVYVLPGTSSAGEKGATRDPEEEIEFNFCDTTVASEGVLTKAH